jgi:hypothetical protein
MELKKRPKPEAGMRVIGVAERRTAALAIRKPHRIPKSPPTFR